MPNHAASNPFSYSGFLENIEAFQKKKVEKNS